MLNPIPLALLAEAKWAFTTRRVEPADVRQLMAPGAGLRSGDLLLARVESLGQHSGLQLASGRRADLYVGDLAVLCLGARYAPDQFEGVAELAADGRCELLAGGGVAGTMRYRHASMRAPTAMRVLAALCDGSGQPINIERCALPTPATGTVTLPVLLVAGSSMNAGKTTTCASLAHGLARAGMRVGAAKLTGTGSFGDVQSYADAGAAEVVDFTDAGFASTYHAPLAKLECAALQLLLELQARGCQVAVAELADGLFQSETAYLLASTRLRSAARGALFAAADAMGAAAGVQRLRALGWAVAGFTGLVTASPLAAAEAERALADAGAPARCWLREQLREPREAAALMGLPCSDQSRVLPTPTKHGRDGITRLLAA